MDAFKLSEEMLARIKAAEAVMIVVGGSGKTSAAFQGKLSVETLASMAVNCVVSCLAGCAQAMRAQDMELDREVWLARIMFRAKDALDRDHGGTIIVGPAGDDDGPCGEGMRRST